MEDCAPAVERPFYQSAASIAARKSATSALLNTFGTQISIAVHSADKRGGERRAR